jgi:metal-responsive CopG/Arc/MetJ family transcriptional regulator
MMPSYDDVMRTIIDLPEEQILALAEVCRREKISRAEAVRRAVAEYASRHATGEAGKAFGVWRGRRVDGLAYERRLRREW